MATSVISARGLTKAFGARLDDLSFQVSPGRVTGFLGPNGAGKTTTLRMLLGLARPTAGTATMLERPYTRLDHPARRVGVVLDTAVFHPPAKRPQPPALDGRGDRRGRQGPHRGGPGGRRPGAGGRPAGRGVLAWDAPAAGAGGGSTGELELLVLDEPANGLDPAGIRWLREFLRGFARSGGAVFVSSHLLGEIGGRVGGGRGSRLVGTPGRVRMEAASGFAGGRLGWTVIGASHCCDGGSLG
jgi:ABC-2 type transport system ATP-binding protein